MENVEIGYWKNKFEDYLKANPFDDGSHDLGHFRRVWKLADKLSSVEGDKLVILAACYFHDIVNYPKNDEKCSQLSQDAARKGKEILREMGFPQEKLDHVAHCIEAHSFSADIKSKTLEAKIVQDSDRMESLGAIGLPRTFYIAGRMGSKIFDENDPLALKRKLDDKKFAIDHFKTKLLKLPSAMKTNMGKQEAAKRAQVLEYFLKTLESEL